MSGSFAQGARAPPSSIKTRLREHPLNMAVHQRRPQEVIHHSDQGSQYTSVAFGKRCREVGVRPSTGSVLLLDSKPMVPNTRNF